MRRSWVIALLTTILLSAAVSFELRGVRQDGSERTDVSTAELDPTASRPLVNGRNVAAPQTTMDEPATPPLAGRRLPPPLPVSEGPIRAESGPPPAVSSERDEQTDLPRRAAIELAPTELEPAGGSVQPAPEEAAAPSRVTRLPDLALDPPDQAPVHAEPTLPPHEPIEDVVQPLAAGDHWQALTMHALAGPRGMARPESSEGVDPRETVTTPFADSGRATHSATQAQRDVSWWSQFVPAAQREGSRPQPLDLATLVQETLLHSEHIRAISLEAEIRETEITQADAAFDPAAFIESKWADLSDPVGNLLTTGGPPRLSREEWVSNIGFRRKTQSGGRLEVAQKLTEEDNNSVFFVPANQATSRLTLSLNQPLLRGAGQTYNRSLVVLAQHDTQVARDQFRSELEERVLLVVRAYWDLYYNRAVLLQQRDALRQAQEIQADILARESFDSLGSQVHRVTSTVNTRQASIARAAAEIKKAESRLRALTTSPLLGGMDTNVELLPVEPPPTQEVVLEPDDARRLALANRTEIDAALTEVRAAGVRLGVAQNEMLPSLGLVLETYVSGLEGGFDLPQSFGEQFSEGAPSYTAGLLFEIPLGRRAAGAVQKRRELELRQAERFLRQTVADLSLDVEIALQEVETTWQELLAHQAAAEATAAEVRQLRARLSLIPGTDHTAVSFQLDELLNAIDRLVRDESELAEAQRNYAVSIAEFHKATGTLVTVDTGPPSS